VSVRVAMAVVLAVALLAASMPGVQSARERATADAIRSDARTLAAAVDAMRDAERGSRRVVAVEVPAASVGTVAVSRVSVSNRTVRYRLESGRRGGVALPASVRVGRGDALVLRGAGTHHVVVTATARGVVVSHDPLRLGRVGVDERLYDVTRPASACSTWVRTVRARRASTTGHSGLTPTTVGAAATW